MNSKLFDILVDRGIITDNTEIGASVRNADLSGVAHLRFDGVFNYIAHFVDEDGTGSVMVESVVDGSRASLRYHDINTIDGMEPMRIASIYALSPTGDAVRQPARRGRKPKNRAA